MELWLLAAFLPPLLFSVNNIIDQFVSRDYFADSVRAFLCLGGMVNLAVLPFIYLFNPDVFHIEYGQALLLIIGGLIYMCACFPYIKALQSDDASHAIPLFQIVPLFVLALGWITLGETLTTKRLIAGAIIFLGSVGIVWDFSTHIVKGRLYVLMALSSFLFAVYVTLMRFGAVELDWITTLFWIMAGWSLFGLILFCFCQNTRQTVLQTTKESKGKVIGISCIQEGADILGAASLAFAMVLAPSAALLIVIVNGLQPLFAILLSGICGLFFPRLFTPINFNRDLIQKLICSFIMFYGMYLLI
jgi:drug/metabolite transporter (DMT)-like permease